MFLLDWRCWVLLDFIQNRLEVFREWPYPFETKDGAGKRCEPFFVPDFSPAREVRVVVSFGPLDEFAMVLVKMPAGSDGLLADVLCLSLAESLDAHGSGNEEKYH